MVAKGLSLNVRTSKVMISDGGEGSITKSGNWPFAVCK